MGYVLLLLAGKHLSSAENAVFLGFWGLLMGVGSALSPVEQELSRQTAQAAAQGRKPDLSAARTFAVTESVAIAVAAVLAVPAVNAQLFVQHRELALVAACGVVAFPALYALRGLFIGAGQNGRYSAILLAEAAARLVLFVGFVVAGVSGLTWLAVAVAVGSCAWLPFAFRARGLVEPGPSSEAWSALQRRMLGLIVSAALTASVLTGYPAVVKLVAPRGSEDALGGLFLAVSLLRSPLLLVLAPIQTLAVPTVVRLLHQPDGTPAAEVRGLRGGRHARCRLGCGGSGVCGGAVGVPPALPGQVRGVGVDDGRFGLVRDRAGGHDADGGGAGRAEADGPGGHRVGGGGRVEFAGAAGFARRDPVPRCAGCDRRADGRVGGRTCAGRRRARHEAAPLRVAVTLTGVSAAVAGGPPRTGQSANGSVVSFGPRAARTRSLISTKGGLAT
ncbi:hypothetical protein [Amycolatopsis sp. NPDC003731]